jgi:hypothetical protein
MKASDFTSDIAALLLRCPYQRGEDEAAPSNSATHE